MTDYRAKLKELLQDIVYTNKYNSQENINIYYEEDVTEGRARFKTPALIIRGLRQAIDPADIGWNIYINLYEIDVSLYLKLRSDNYSAEEVREEVTNQIIKLAEQNKDGLTSNDIYLRLAEIRDRNYLEEVGILRRDFSFKIYKEG
ncbi:MAG: hypothetical protein H0Z19_07280 [Archaeoglobus sp.]|uniref:hypothetical protein n=1 Tax=Archaeoglobus sp. TaxID=1872626 RepID=UPI001E11F948|nr:hypothetical protein [Archaeoglobus sp.]MBO8180266.1 hypothetical protein [Archaeoglobus sp.]